VGGDKIVGGQERHAVKIEGNNMLRAFATGVAVGVLGFGLAPTVSAAPQVIDGVKAGPSYGVGPELPASPLSQQNAVSAAEDYIQMSAFSRQGLIKQLEYEGYSTADATYGVNSLAVDWNQQAVRMAKGYLEMSPFSRSSLIQQLVYEGFTPSQAAYGVAATGL
jgi:hypothetical protein